MGLSKKLLTGAIVSGLGGLLFGFDTAVISGAEQGLKVFFDLDPVAHGFTNSIALIGTILLYRFLGGLGVGASSVIAPMYISEI